MSKPVPPRIASAATIQGKTTLLPRIKKRGSTPWISSTFYIPRQTYERLRANASEQKTSIQQLLEVALDEWLAKTGEPPFYPDDFPRAIPKKTKEEPELTSSPP